MVDVSTPGDWEVDSAPGDYDDVDPDFDDDNTDFDDDEQAQDIEHAEEAKHPAYANVIEFVEGFFLDVIRRKVTDGSPLSWDARWWLYPEVVARLTALYYAYEESRASTSGLAMSSWWIQHLEPHLRVILDGDTGPMANARTDGSFSGWPRMPAEPVPSEVRDLLLNQ
ncbi:DUF4913 domain-containing protein [Rhodococcus sp. Q]|uniref:DUF4913 domain-containing protein n=1 Tax=Rhodococcus sp. Q TaxID=2502252 RepID=UPI0010F78C74|nr:DUF4913 domain-containing protein [Rhodococcus sp. Q]